MPTTKPTLTEDHHERVFAAEEAIERAQHLIDDAAQLLCPVDGFADEWSASHKVHDSIKRYWHRVEKRRQQLRPPQD